MGARRSALALLCLLAAAPIVWSAAVLWGEWHPVGDVAIAGLRAHDVISADPPLVGMPTTLSRSIGQQAYHPGPMEFWLLALPVWLTGGSRLAPMVTIAALNAAAAAAVVVLARRSNAAAAVAATAGLLVMQGALRGETLVDPWNPHAALLPLTLCLAALAADRVGTTPWALPAAAAAGSLAAQAHLAPAMAVVGAALGWALLLVLQRRRGGGRVRDRSRRGAPVIAVAVVLLLSWAPVAVAEVTRSPGNLELLLRGDSRGRQTELLGADSSVALIANALAPPAVWMSPRTDPGDPLRPPPPTRVVLAVAIAAAAAAVGTRWWRRDEPLALAVTTVAGGMLLVGAAAAASIPASSALGVHSFLWTWVAGAAIWTALVGGVVAIVVERLRQPLARRVVGATALVLAVVAVAGTPPRVVGARRTMAAIPSVARQLAATLPPGTYRLQYGGGDIDAGSAAMGLLYALEKTPLDLRAAPRAAPSVGSRRTIRIHLADEVLVVTATRSPAPAPSPDALLVAEGRPDRRAVRELEASERTVREAIERHGGVRLTTGQEWDVDEGAALLRSGRLTLFARLGVLERPHLSARTADRLAAAQAGPVYFVRVFRQPAPASGAGRVRG